MTPEITYPLAPQGTYWTIQGEGALTGLPMVFVRLAGCDVNCAQCDTDYSVYRRASALQIAREAASLASQGTCWAWLTGGEPLIHDIMPLVQALRGAGLKVALATAGHHVLPHGLVMPGSGLDFLSVSPHSPDGWLVRHGDQVNLVPGLGSLSWADIEAMRAECEEGFARRYVTPCDTMPSTREECLQWVRKWKGWNLGTQVHKLIGLP